jgi:hypothetical protein
MNITHIQNKKYFTNNKADVMQQLEAENVGVQN